MVSSGIDMVYSDGVGAQFLHQGRVEFALGSVDKRVVVSQLVGDAWQFDQSVQTEKGSTFSHTLDEELIAVGSEEFGTHSRDLGNSGDLGGLQSQGEQACPGEGGKASEHAESE
jgi:hypothetical protein